MNTTYSKNRAAGLCGQCGKVPSVSVRCGGCTTKHRSRYNTRKAAGLCPNCNSAEETAGAMCRTCLDKSSAKSKRYRCELIQEVLTYYGGECACCGEKEFAFLEVDHTNNDGAEHRRSLKQSDRAHFYRWLKRNNFPKGFQILCANCNRAKWRCGTCPHQRKIQEDHLCQTKPRHS